MVWEFVRNRFYHSGVVPTAQSPSDENVDTDSHLADKTSDLDVDAGNQASGSDSGFVKTQISGSGPDKTVSDTGGLGSDSAPGDSGYGHGDVKDHSSKEKTPVSVSPATKFPVRTQIKFKTMFPTQGPILTKVNVCHKVDLCGIKPQVD